jgi:hypothetical protein
VGEEVAGLPRDPAVAGFGPGGTDAAAEEGGELRAEAIGAYLARQRRLRGIDLPELARVTCIPLRSLERLESGAFDATPDGFARGFVRTVASALGLDPDDAVARMLPEATQTPARRAPPLPEPSPWTAVVLGALAIAAVGIILVEWSGTPGDPSDVRAQHVYRRDAIRELARAEGLIPPRGTAEIVALDPAPPAAEPDAAPPAEIAAAEPSGAETSPEAIPDASPEATPDPAPRVVGETPSGPPPAAAADPR